MKRRLYLLPAVVCHTVLLIGCAPATETHDSPTRPDIAATEIPLCEMTVSSPPSAEQRTGSGMVCADSVAVQLNPTRGGCISSGFGPRSGKIHKGVDFHSRPAVDVVAAAGGIVLDKGFRQEDYGNWLVIDHGNGVYSSYAHLANFEPGLAQNTRVSRGQTLGLMGKTGDSTEAVHLHHEVRKGDYNNPKGWWGLEPVNTFALPATAGDCG